jgi:polysaccharide biosynthesis protein PslH
MISAQWLDAMGRSKCLQQLTGSNADMVIEPGASRDVKLPSKMDVRPAARQLRIAIAYSRLPFPMMRGDQLTVAHLIEYLAARGHQVDLYTLNTDGELTPEQEDWLARSCNEVRRYDRPRLISVLGALAGLLKGWPLQVGYFQSRALSRDLRTSVDDGKYDIVYVYYLRSAPVISKDLLDRDKNGETSGRSVAAFLAMQLSQTLNTERIYRNERNLAKKLMYFFEWKLLERYEARIWKDFDRVVLIGSKDIDAVKAACRRQGTEEISNWIYGAHGTSMKHFRPATDEDVVEHRLVFSGAMVYQPNIQAVLWFVQNCWTQIREKVPTATLYIVGRNPAPAVLELDGKNAITVTGTVPDVGEYIRSAHVCINPMLSAGGMQNKLIEYMACAKAVVATSIANEGIQAPDGEALTLADDPNSFASKILELLGNTQRAKDLGTAARGFVLKNWTWEAHFQQLEDNYVRALQEVSGEKPETLQSTSMAV